MRGEIQNAPVPQGVGERRRVAQLVASLTDFEKLVLELYLRGAAYEEIRYCAGSQISVAFHLARIRAKYEAVGLSLPYRHPKKRRSGRKCKEVAP